MLLFYVAFSLLAFDQLTKFLVLERLTYEGSIPVLQNVFHLTFVKNTGIAFGFFNNNPLILTVLISFCVLVLLLYSGKIVKKSIVEKIAYGLILGGAAGNLIDRFRFGWVVDFLDFRVWPVFNLADSGITIGVILFAWIIIFGHDREEKINHNG